MTKLARRITEASPKSFGMFEKAMALQASGADLIHLEVGRPCHDTPESIKDATIAALRQGHVHYSDMRGLPELREALAEKLAAENGMTVSPDEILVTNGLTHAAFAAIMATIDPGDEVIHLEPFYPQHVGKVELAGGTMVGAPLDAASGFRIDTALIEPRITGRTKAIVLINPCNPTGRVYDRSELEQLADLAIRHDLLVISDEVYEKVLYDGNRHTSIASLPGMAERTVTLLAFTKAYAMDGWRLGCAIASREITDAMLKITMNDVTHVNTFIQYGALEAIRSGDAMVEGMKEADRAQRDRMVRALNQMPGVTCATPEGTIYAFPDVSALGKPSQEIAEAILEKAHVVVEAGSFYGPAGEGHLRMCFGSESEERLGEALDRLARFFNDYGQG
ncbi:aspartate aminotransferase [Novosphingobium sp. PC22D]|uniref:pyridoxal phosphate-dependent aminotransferase n=1 Tax=Novosphingobium sp. PC22D TaxID=1962403 RepID=UPI000BEF9D6D|nr:pyridoxal phosphate-dependent aminotransferase [Novosphingobium sp. PC22D]PEQ13082.1 aspartate aminotransferase [Novosphingobium sp. PC22D]